MKTLKLFLLLLCFTVSLHTVFSQKKSYPEVGAMWYYHWFNMSGGQGYYTMEVAKDTLIQEKTCFVFELTQHFKNYPSKYMEKNYVLYEDNKIYQYHEENFYLLYDFTVQVGDTIRTEFIHWEKYIFPVELEVIKVEEIEIEGETLISYDAVPTEKTYDILGNGEEYSVYFYGGIENIGNHYFFFPTFDNIGIGDYLVGNPSSLNCYMNGDFYYKNEQWQKDCDYTYQPSSIDEYDNHRYSIYLNADNTILKILGIEQYPVEYNITHTNGNTIINGKLSNNDIDISTLQSGVYILQIDTPTPASYKFVKK